MKKILVMMSIAILLLSSCAAVQQNPNTGGTEAGYLEGAAGENTEETGLNGEIHGQTVEDLSASDLSEEEIAGLLFMREEEKLARDVYLQLADMWGLNIFSNIAASEQTHLDAVLTLIDAAGLEDPAYNLVEGEFHNQELQELYAELIDRGGNSLEEALLVGGAIEEIDILDLQDYLAATENDAVAAIYQNLLNGSVKHLQSFTRTYESQTGEVYQPQYLSNEDYQQILEDAASPGGEMGQGRSEQPPERGRGRNN